MFSTITVTVSELPLLVVAVTVGLTDGIGAAVGRLEPASGRYWFGSPLGDKAEICVAQEGGRPVMFSITVKDNSAENRYIQSVLLNGEPYYKGYIEHKDIAAGGELVLQMGAEPVLWY